MTQQSQYNPRTLYAFLPEECLETGVRAGGWSHFANLVPAFDPDMKDIEEIREGFGNGRTLVEISPAYREKFAPRLTGPEREFQGLYAS